MQHNSSIAQSPAVVTKTPQQITFLPPDGPHYNPAINEYEVWFNGEIINYATHESTAHAQYRQALTARRRHAERNPANAGDAGPRLIPYTRHGQAVLLGVE